MKKAMSWEEQERRIDERIKLQDDQLRAYLAMAKSFECAVCAEHGHGVSLLGGFKTVLCDEHLNAWREFFHSHELSGEYNDAQADFYVAIYQRSEETAREQNRIWQHVADAICKLSEEWLEEEKVKWQER